jgi:hypothetical protein
MWWDWSEITLLDSVMFSLLSVLTLYLVGTGVLRLICALSKKVDPFGSFDFLVKTNFRILFGFIFVFLFLLVFSFFNLPFLVSTLLIVAIAIIGFVTTNHRIKLRLPEKIRFHNYAPVLFVFLIILTTLFFSSMLISGFYGSTNDDGADHTLAIRVILNNPSSLITRVAQPYAAFMLSYPSGTHGLSAFLLTLLNVPIQKIVMLASTIMPSLIALSFYSTINCLFKNKALSVLGLIVASFFTIGLSWAPVFWGGLPLLLSFYVSISGMGVIYVFLLEDKMIWLNAALLGLVFFISFQTYPVAVLMLGFWFMLILIFKLVPRFRNIRSWEFSVSSIINRRNMTFMMSFLVPILFSVPYLFSYYTNEIAGARFPIVSSLNSVSTVTSEIVKTKISFNWVFDIPALSFFFSEFGKLLSLASISLILIILLFISMRSRRITSVFLLKKLAKGLSLIYFFIMIIMSFLASTLFLGIPLFSNLFDPERVWQHIFIPATMMTAVVIFSAIYFGYLASKRLFYSKKKRVAKITKYRILMCVVLALVMLFASLASIPAIAEQQNIYKKVGLSFDTFETLSQDDLSLMKWIAENVPSQARILVSAGDSGQFVTPVTQRYTVSRYSYLTNFSNLMVLLTSNASDSRAVPLLVEYNVSYVYVGSTATIYALQNPSYRHFNVTQIFVTSYFTLAKEVGDAWLFQFNQTLALSGFEHATNT